VGVCSFTQPTAAAARALLNRRRQQDGAGEALVGCTHPSRGLACELGFVLGLCVAAPLPSPYGMTRQRSHRVLGMERARLVPPFGAVVDGGFLVTGAPQTLQPAARAQWLHLLFLMRSTWHAAAHTEVMMRPGRHAHAAPPPASSPHHGAAQQKDAPAPQGSRQPCSHSRSPPALSAGTSRAHMQPTSKAPQLDQAPPTALARTLRTGRRAPAPTAAAPGGGIAWPLTPPARPRGMGGPATSATAAPPAARPLQHRK